MRSDRLLSILLLLQAHGRLSARDIAARLETSVRTIYRDIDALSQAGVPVFTERGRRGGTAILPGYRTDVTGLTPAEAEAIFVAAGRGALADLGLEEELRLGLRKLMAALPERAGRTRSAPAIASSWNPGAGCANRSPRRGWRRSVARCWTGTACA